MELAVRNDSSRPEPKKQDRQHQHGKIAISCGGGRRNHTVKPADDRRSGDEAQHAAETAHDENEEGAQNVVESHEWLHWRERRDHDPAETCKAGADNESTGCQLANRNALSLRELGVADHRADPAASAATAVPDHQPGDDRQRDGYQHQSIDRVFGAEKVHRAGKRDGNAAKAEAEYALRDLAQQQAKAPGGHQRVERPAVERPDHDPLDRPADDAANRERQRQSDEVWPLPGLDEIGAIGAYHDEFPVRDVEYAQQTENDGETEGENGKRADSIEDVDRLRDDQRIHSRTSSRTANRRQALHSSPLLTFSKVLMMSNSVPLQMARYSVLSTCRPCMVTVPAAVAKLRPSDAAMHLLASVPPALVASACAQ